jgi:hypothetical protein
MASKAAKPKPVAAKRKKKPEIPKTPPKAAPRTVTKAAEKVEGPLPLSQFDYTFCQFFVSTGKQTEAYRQTNPEHKDPALAAHRMMKRPEIRDHIREIYRIMSRDRMKAAEIAARANLLTLEVADDRLMEIMATRRKSRGEMFSKDIKQLMVKGAIPLTDDDGNVTGYTGDDAFRESLEQGAPVEDKDLLTAIKLTYDRRQGIIKAEKPAAVSGVTVMLYKPKWFGVPRETKTLEATA